ncbi:hypothetical protein [Actinomadura rudentiformis]|uniref:Uncharacterized protein n=1 Tax=Actinomadura rudentiformis TaxID=359158 RepID=A0A6H9YN96_9ACTN|nr:hypothetical protein [Actinomadura rudentiformis]KAB2341282.1 hypothetical protein F8566_41920 [Actinomadura rudentiformis]
MSTTMSVSELAQILFTTPLQASATPSSGQVRAAIETRLAQCGNDCATCLARVAQEAGDHPEAYAARMRWALDAVETAYFRLAVAA